MLNSNGKLISSFSEIQADFIKQLHTQFSYSEVLRFENNHILFWELHYFRIIASLRRHRFEIPMNYTMEYLEDEIIKLINSQSTQSEAVLIRIQFLPYQKSIHFLMSLTIAKPLHSIVSVEDYSLDLFKEVGIQANNLSNLSTTNATLFTIGKRYAEENGLNDCVFLNDQKNLVETLQGSLYLLQGGAILTPDLNSGCQDFALRSAFNEWLDKKQKSFQLIEQAVNPFELQKSEELMVLSLKYGGQQIRQYRKTSYKSNKLLELFNSFVSNLY